MGALTILALRVVIGIALAGSLVVQVAMMPLVWIDLEGTRDWLRIALIVLPIAGIATLQVSAFCVWHLLTMVRRGSVFTAAAFRYVDIVIGAIGAASVLMFLLAVVLAPGAHRPGSSGLSAGHRS